MQGFDDAMQALSKVAAFVLLNACASDHVQVMTQASALSI